MVPRESRPATKGEKASCRGSGGSQHSTARQAENTRAGHCAPHTVSSQLLGRGEGQMPSAGVKRAAHPSKSKNSVHPTTDRPMPGSPRDTEPAWSENSTSVRPRASENSRREPPIEPLPRWSCRPAAELCKRHRDRRDPKAAAKRNQVGTEEWWSRRPRGPRSKHRRAGATGAASSLAARSYRSRSLRDGCGSLLGKTDVPQPQQAALGQASREKRKHVVGPHGTCDAKSMQPIWRKVKDTECGGHHTRGISPNPGRTLRLHQEPGSPTDSA